MTICSKIQPAYISFVYVNGILHYDLDRVLFPPGIGSGAVDAGLPILDELLRVPGINSGFKL